MSYQKRTELTGIIHSPTIISQIVWRKQNINIDISGTKYSGSQCIVSEADAKLVINKIDSEDIGEYCLIVENGSGRARSNSVSLKIKESKSYIIL